ncbi:hypothetical protein EXIGLDRAFT_758615 [Exidia glandulosa HHB12029]|uniref:Uncharacterized protein n=1 Tax=Exidia glandulosa HHB12029 TaxID=1314781 RepID=A0A165R0H8_EXIGL|nr:hypothetical protein EXIGLDRAFT_758615 [Exidia glandulosa HHB12029]
MQSRAFATTSDSGSASTVFVLPLESIPDFPDLLSGRSPSIRAGSLASHRTHQSTRASQDGAISSQRSVIPLGRTRRRLVAPSDSSCLRHTASLTDLDAEFSSVAHRRLDAFIPTQRFCVASLLGDSPEGSDFSSETQSSPSKLRRSPAARSTPRTSRTTTTHSDKENEEETTCVVPSEPHYDAQQRHADSSKRVGQLEVVLVVLPLG